MNKILYFDCSNGVAGDMIVASLINLGLDFKLLKKSIEDILPEINIKYNIYESYGISAGKFSVIDKETSNLVDNHENNHHKHRCLKDIKKIIDNSSLSKNIKSQSIDIFTLIANAEAEVHNTSLDNIHFHEVGALDSICDIVSSVYLINEINPKFIVSSPINVGYGKVKCSHGILNVPAPATLKLLRNITCFSDGTPYELATPTGVAIIKYFSMDYVNMPLMNILNNGNGMGSIDIGRPNIFRAILGEKNMECKKHSI